MICQFTACCAVLPPPTKKSINVGLTFLCELSVLEFYLSFLVKDYLTKCIYVDCGLLKHTVGLCES